MKPTSIPEDARALLEQAYQSRDLTRRCDVTLVAGAVSIALVALLMAGCGPRLPQTEAERFDYGRQLVQRMSDRLGAATVFSVATAEQRVEVKRNGEEVPVSLTRETIVRRPDRFYFKTSSGVDNEGWYDGVGLTLVMHGQKVFAQARMPETLDRTLDAVAERYGVSMPLADLMYSNPAKILLTETTKGGWVGREQIDGRDTDHLSFTDHGVAWEVWIPVDGEPLPVRAKGDFPSNKRIRRFDLTFKNWNLAPTVADQRFEPTVPADYEGIAMIQRSVVVSHMPEASPETPSR